MTALTYYCPNCGGDLRFDAERQRFTCAYCRSDFAQEEIKPPAEAESKAFAGQIDTYYCQSCGAQIFTDATTAASFCCYCHNPVILAPKLTGQAAPDGVIPFAISREAAQAAFLRWRKGKILAPAAFSAPRQLETMTGLYLPYYLTDVCLNAQLNAKASTSRSWRSGDINYTETSNYNVFRHGRVHLANIFDGALLAADHKLLEGIQPYDYSKVQPFEMAYLSGYYAQKRDLEPQDLQDNLHQDLRRYAQGVLEQTIRGYDRVYAQQTDYTIEEMEQRYILLPVWLLSYQFHGRNYLFALNGQTGAVYGELPLSRGRLAGLFGGVFAITWAVSFALGGLL